MLHADWLISTSNDILALLVKAAMESVYSLARKSAHFHSQEFQWPSLLRDIHLLINIARPQGAQDYLIALSQ